MILEGGSGSDESLLVNVNDASLRCFRTPMKVPHFNPVEESQSPQLSFANNRLCHMYTNLTFHHEIAPSIKDAHNPLYSFRTDFGEDSDLAVNGKKQRSRGGIEYSKLYLDAFNNKPVNMNVKGACQCSTENARAPAHFSVSIRVKGFEHGLEKDKQEIKNLPKDIRELCYDSHDDISSAENEELREMVDMLM